MATVSENVLIQDPHLDDDTQDLHQDVDIHALLQDVVIQDLHQDVETLDLHQDGMEDHPRPGDGTLVHHQEEGLQDLVHLQYQDLRREDRHPVQGRNQNHHEG